MFGVASAPAIWQREIEKKLNDIPGVTVFLDDINITCANDREFLERLELVLKRLHEHSLKLLLQCREMPHSFLNMSPLVLMFGREIRYRLDLIKPAINIEKRLYKTKY